MMGSECCGESMTAEHDKEGGVGLDLDLIADAVYRV